MGMIIEVLSWIFFLLGGFLCLTGAVGLLRLPDFFSRVHANSITETLAAPLLLCGVMLQIEPSLDTVKLLMVLFFLLSTSPTSTHALVKGALLDGELPTTGVDPADAGEEDESSNS